MKLMLSVSPSVALAAILSTAALAQTATQPSGDSLTQATAKQQDEKVTVVGCVQREADYRRARDAGKGGVAGTGIGGGNEYVLVNASIASGASGTATKGTETGAAYELSGKNEGQVGQYVGQRVEISGVLKPAEIGAAGPTGGATAGAPPKGVDVTSKDLKLRELEVTTVRTATGTCPAQ